MNRERRRFRQVVKILCLAIILLIFGSVTTHAASQIKRHIIISIDLVQEQQGKCPGYASVAQILIDDVKQESYQASVVPGSHKLSVNTPKENNIIIKEIRYQDWDTFKYPDGSTSAIPKTQTFTPNAPEATVSITAQPPNITSASQAQQPARLEIYWACQWAAPKLLQLVPLGNVVPSVRNDADPFAVYPGDTVKVTGVVYAVESADGMLLKNPQNVQAQVEISQGVATNVQKVTTDAQGYYEAEYQVLDQDTAVIVVKAFSPDPNRYADGFRVYDIDLKKRGTLSVTVATDKAVYAPGETVTVSGNVLADGKPIGANIAPTSDIFPLLSLTTGNGSFHFSFTPGQEPKRNLVGPFQNGLHVASATAVLLGYQNGRGSATYLVEQSLTCTSLSAQVVDAAGVAHVAPIDPNSLQVGGSLIQASLAQGVSVNTNTKLTGGLKLQTEKGARVALRFEGEQGATATVAIADSTTVQIQSFCKDKNTGRIQAVLVIDGPGQVVVNKTTTGNVFSNLDLAVVTRGARVKSVNTRYFVGVDSQGTTTVGALEGTVLVSDPNGANSIDVPAGKQISVQRNQAPNRLPVMPISGRLDPALDTLLANAPPPRGNAFPPLVSAGGHGAGMPPPPSIAAVPTAPAPSPAVLDLTGLWLDSGGRATYRVRQVGNRVYWSVDAGAGGSINIYMGEISGNTINGLWVDLPQSSTYNTGQLNLRIDSNDHLVKVGENPCCYGAQEWRRQGTTASAVPPNTGGAGIGGGGGGGSGGGVVPAAGPVIGWNIQATGLRGKNGQRVPYTCPPNGAVGRGIWGTDIYTDDSEICPAAVHAGLITFQKGGPVTIEILPGQSSYTASARNGVSSGSYAAWTGSFRFVPNDVVGIQQQILPREAGPTGSAGLGAGGKLSMEQGTNRRGQDYRNFDLAQPRPDLCQAECAGDAKCKAYTYVKPGVQGPRARCWLKSGVPTPQADSCCVSGVKGAK